MGKGRSLSAAKPKLPELIKRIKVDAELLYDVALHLNHGDLEQHLLLTLNREHVDELTGCARLRS